MTAPLAMSLPSMPALTSAAELPTEPTVRAHVIRVRNSDATFRCLESESLLQAALRSGIGHPYECSSGGCGSCLFDLVDGEISDQWPQAPGLSQRSRERGKRLACQSSPRSECTVSFRPQAHCVPAIRPRRHSARLVSARPLTRDVALFTFRTHGPAEFLPGQYALLQLPGVIGTRAYSMSNRANDQGVWEFIVKRMPAGRGTDVLFTRLLGSDDIVLDAPFGISHLRPDSSRDLVCIGGGSGLSPLMSILSAAAREPRCDSKRLTLFYGGRTSSDLCADALIRQDPALARRLAHVNVVSDEGSDSAWSGERGFVHEVLERWLASGVADPKQHDYYFCGPPKMTESVQRVLMQARIPVGQLFHDRFI